MSRLISILTAVVLNAANVLPSGLAVREDGTVWLSVTFGSGASGATLSLYSAAFDGASVPSDWSGPHLTLSQPGASVLGGSLFAAPDGSLQLYYSLSDSGMAYMRSLSGGEWSAPVKVGAGTVTTPPVALSDGSLVLATLCSSGPDSRRGVLVFISKDGGHSWKDSGVVINVPERRTAAGNNPKLFTMPDGRAAMLLRSCDSGFCYYSVSPDGGRSWSLPEKFVQNPDRDAAIKTIPDGKLLLVKNFKLDFFQTYPARELFSYYSADAGASWYPGPKVTADDYAVSPQIALTPSGDVLVAWGREHPMESEVKMALLSAGEASQQVIFSAGGALEAFEKRTAAVSAPHSEWQDKPLKVATFNIQRQGWGSGPKWDDRREAAIEQFRKHDWDIVGTQEASPAYADEICKALGGAYAWVGNTREWYGDAYRGGSEQCLFYRKERFKLLAWGPLEYAIDRTRFQGAIVSEDSYGVDYYKATTWAKFLDKATGAEFYIYNLHFPVRADAAQAAEAMILRDDLVTRCEGLPVLITGDFNCMETSWAYHYLTELPYLADTMLALPPEQRVNAEYDSFQGYRKPGNSTKGGTHHDHIFYTPALVKVLGWELDYDIMYKGKIASDHVPITVEVVFAK